MIIRSAIAFTVLVLSGCATQPLFSLPISSDSGNEVRILTNTAVALSKNNFSVVEANLIGESWGVNLFGLIPVKSPQYTEAINQIYSQSEPVEGKSRALVNIVHENSSTFYLLFSIPLISVRADIVEFHSDATD